MSEPIREQLLVAITLAVHGKYGVPAPTDERDLPVTIVQDAPDEASENYGSTHLVTNIAIARAEQSLSADRNELRKQGNRLQAQIIQDMHADPTFGGLADGVDYVGGGNDAQVGKFVFAEASFNIRWHHIKGDPYHIDEPEED